LYWLAKVAAMKGLGAAPGGMKMYSTLQRIVTRSTTPTQHRIDGKIGVASEYLTEIQGRIPVPMSEVTHIDVGTGWMPTIPLLFYSLGVERQMLCDVRANLSLDRVVQTASLVRTRLEPAAEVGGFPVQRVPTLDHQHPDLTSCLSSIGMEYRVPYTTSDFSRTSGWKLVSCTQVLQHLRYHEIVELLRGVARAIAGGGLFVTTIHLYDLYSDSDPNVSRFNKYRYSDWVWERFCTSRAMYFNRLTSSDYERAFAEAGLRLLKCKVNPPTDEQLRELRGMKIHPQFRSVPEAELAAQGLLLIGEAAERR
jgi:hypothetical protein